jgi:hypothetical protein
MSLAARMITPADVKTAKGFVAQLNEMKSREGARRAGSAETARTRDVRWSSCIRPVRGGGGRG